jgi:dipeptidyl aminopeptidase/acylaminoacyl peptidase
VSLVALLLAGYLGIALYVATVLTLPQRDPVAETPADLGLAYQEVGFPARGGDVTIAGSFIPRQGATRALVLVHGKDSNRSTEFGNDFTDFGAALHERGFAVLLIDLRGHGASGDARFTFGIDERRDVLGALDWLVAQGFAPSSVGVLGVSMGAAAVIGAAAEEPALGAVVADCSYAEIEPLLERHWTSASGLPNAFLPATLLMGRLVVGHDLTQADPVRDIVRIAPERLLLIHGAADTFTPVEHGQQLAAASPGAAYWEVPGANHAASYRENPQGYVERVVGFFVERVGETR